MAAHCMLVPEPQSGVFKGLAVFNLQRAGLVCAPPLVDEGGCESRMTPFPFPLDWVLSVTASTTASEAQFGVLEGLLGDLIHTRECWDPACLSIQKSSSEEPRCPCHSCCRVCARTLRSEASIGWGLGYTLNPQP